MDLLGKPGRQWTTHFWQYNTIALNYQYEAQPILDHYRRSNCGMLWTKKSDEKIKYVIRFDFEFQLFNRCEGRLKEPGRPPTHHKMSLLTGLWQWSLLPTGWVVVVSINLVRIDHCLHAFSLVHLSVYRCVHLVVHTVLRRSVCIVYTVMVVIVLVIQVLGPNRIDHL